MKSSIILGASEDLTANGYRPLIEIVQIADSIGVDVVTVPEHLAMASNNAEFIARYGDNPPVNDRTRLFEPMVFLGALATVTKSITLGTSVVLSPLRPALVMAKQMAVLDYISGGRTLFGLGAGWQKEEFDACNMPWAGRHRHLAEQVQAFRVLWSEAPASFHGEFINFDGLNSFPHPVQGKDIPLFFGVQASDRNIRRMAELGVGWMPMPAPIEALAETIPKIRAQYRAAGRRETDLQVMAFARVDMDSSHRPDLDRTLAMVPEYAEAGVSTLIFGPDAYCGSVKDYPAVLERIVRAVKG